MNKYYGTSKSSTIWLPNGNKLKEKSRDLNRKSSRFFLTNKNETMFGSVYENSPEFGVLGCVIFKLDIV